MVHFAFSSSFQTRNTSISAVHRVQDNKTSSDFLRLACNKYLKLDFTLLANAFETSSIMSSVHVV